MFTSPFPSKEMTKIPIDTLKADSAEKKFNELAEDAPVGMAKAKLLALCVTHEIDMTKLLMQLNGEPKVFYAYDIEGMIRGNLKPILDYITILETLIPHQIRNEV